MSAAVGEGHLNLCERHPHWARNMEHLPGINLTWAELSDRPGHQFPHAGLLDAELRPKQSYTMMLGMKKEIWPEDGIPEVPMAEPVEPWSKY